MEVSDGLVVGMIKAYGISKVEVAAKRMSRVVMWAVWWPILGAALICLALLGLGLWLPRMTSIRYV
ncbi:hypothetical protein N9D66_00300 [Candidatus Nanopelagicales bacterium]|nr:hypothetical protein [Candidatus Nanopelagicales bacterium]